MYKQVMLLGLLLEKPMYGQQIREVIETHHDLFADFIKKPTIYYQLERLNHDGYLEIRRESVEAPGTGYAHEELAQRERDVYYITVAGRQRFHALLREMLGAYTPTLSDVDACLFFLHHLAPDEAVALLKERHALVSRYRNLVTQQMDAHHISDEAHRLVNDHKLTLLDAELNWLNRTIEHLSQKNTRQAT
ncbi:MAG TPA: PadR family transcriptional regulator [Ktedonobacteraceae bacterium]|nr:PadR family transcriptional regulator [Ktedonobacteraceae bacterium]